MVASVDDGSAKMGLRFLHGAGLVFALAVLLTGHGLSLGTDPPRVPATLSQARAATLASLPRVFLPLVRQSVEQRGRITGRVTTADTGRAVPHAWLNIFDGSWD